MTSRLRRALEQVREALDAEDVYEIAGFQMPESDAALATLAEAVEAVEERYGPGCRTVSEVDRATATLRALTEETET